VKVTATRQVGVKPQVGVIFALLGCNYSPNHAQAISFVSRVPTPIPWECLEVSISAYCGDQPCAAEQRESALCKVISGKLNEDDLFDVRRVLLEQRQGARGARDGSSCRRLRMLTR